MRSESLSGQLQRIGGIAAASVVIACALATFAVLHRIVPPPAPARAPQTVPVSATPIGATPASAVAATATGKSVDPLQAAQLQTLNALSRSQQAQVNAARQEAAAVNDRYAKLAKQARQPAETGAGGHTSTTAGRTTSRTGASAPGKTTIRGSHASGGAGL